LGTVEVPKNYDMKHCNKVGANWNI